MSCIGPKSSVAGGLGGLSIKTKYNNKVTNHEPKVEKNDVKEFSPKLLKDVNLKNIKLQ